MRLVKFNYNAGKGKRMFLYGFILAVLLMVLINLFFSQAKYLNVESLKIAEGTINYKPYDFKIMAMYQENENSEYEEIETMPTSGYVINEEKSYCTLDNTNKDSNAILETIDGHHTISNLSKNEKCYLYFDIAVYNLKENIILTNNFLGKRENFSETITTNPEGLYSAEDDDGPSYYFAGATTNNYLKFAGFYWRIIRINGNGSIRILYDGTILKENGTNSQDSIIGIGKFNDFGNDNMYAGYMYSAGEVHGLQMSSTLKNVLESWYNDNIVQKGYSNYIDDDSGFCGDRGAYTDVSGKTFGGGTGATTTVYGSYIRVITNQSPSLKCENREDLFTSKNSSYGNQSLSYSVGSLTMDEVVFIGAVNNKNNDDYYLFNGQYNFTMSPYYFNISTGGARVIAYGYINDSIGSAVVGEAIGSYRPVINLKSTTKVSGTGTLSNPYIVK